MNSFSRLLEQTGGACRTLIRLLPGAALSWAVACMPAHAAVVTFDGLGNSLITHGDSFEQAGLLMTALSADDLALPGDLVGAIVDGSDTGVCAGLSCPYGNSGNYYAALNDSALFIDSAQPGGTFHLRSFDASFIGIDGTGSYPAVAGLLQIQGYYADGTRIFETYALPGPGNNGFSFLHFNTSSTFGQQAFTSVAMFAYVCRTGSGCEAFSSNEGQFAIDNITAVPEPAAWLTLLAGLAALAALRARRRA